MNELIRGSLRIASLDGKTCIYDSYQLKTQFLTLKLKIFYIGIILNQFKVELIL